MAPQSAVYLASPNLWVGLYANREPGWGPTSVRILTTMFCFGGTRRGVCLGREREGGVIIGGVIVAVSVWLWWGVMA